ncbi:hypothetical protein ACTXT7_010354 [Hymenolepis weldensis]
MLFLQHKLPTGSTIHRAKSKKAWLGLLIPYFEVFKNATTQIIFYFTPNFTLRSSPPPPPSPTHFLNPFSDVACDREPTRHTRAPQHALAALALFQFTRGCHERTYSRVHAGISTLIGGAVSRLLLN